MAGLDPAIGARSNLRNVCVADRARWPVDPAMTGAGVLAARRPSTPISGRGARRPSPSDGTALLLDESYNGNGASMRAALDVLRLQPATRRIAVLGDMLELGDAGPGRARRALAAPSLPRPTSCSPAAR